jgi:hypothetical protein
LFNIHQDFAGKTFSSQAVLRCADSLGDFVRGYLPLHNLQDEVWRLLAMLLWLEASIYTLDEANEDALVMNQVSFVLFCGLYLVFCSFFKKGVL